MKILTYLSVIIGLMPIGNATAQTLPTIMAEGGDMVGFTEDYKTLRGCCGVPPQNHLVASSTMPAQGKSTYSIQNIADDNPFTAWTEGKDDYGIGEYFEFDYTFEKSPGWDGYCDQVWIANGYQKSKSLWSANARVKKIKVYLNRKPFAYVKLNDLMGEQYFSLNFAKWQGSQNSVKIRFEIAEVYPGTKWKDVAVSEVYFSCSP
jgi:hypothetical protein